MGTQVINVPPGGTAVSNFDLQPSSEVGEAPRTFAGTDQAAMGIAALVDTSFWRSKRGLAVIFGGSAAGLVLIGAAANSGSSSTTIVSDPNP